MLPSNVLYISKTFLYYVCLPKEICLKNFKFRALHKRKTVLVKVASISCTNKSQCTKLSIIIYYMMRDCVIGIT